jgi:hypothetical protein
MVESYLKEMGVQAKYAELMFSIPKDEVRWIGKADFDADFSGDIPELRDWIDARCNRFTDFENAFWKNVEGRKTRDRQTDTEKAMSDMLWEKYRAQVRCGSDMRQKLHKEAWTQMFKSNGAGKSLSWWRRILEGLGLHGGR